MHFSKVTLVPMTTFVYQMVKLTFLLRTVPIQAAVRCEDPRLLDFYILECSLDKLNCNPELYISSCFTNSTKPKVNIPGYSPSDGDQFLIVLMEVYGETIKIIWLEENVPGSHIASDSIVKPNGSEIVGYEPPHPHTGVYEYEMVIYEQITDIPESTANAMKRARSRMGYFNALRPQQHVSFGSAVGLFDFTVNSEEREDFILEENVEVNLQENVQVNLQVNCADDDLLDVSYRHCEPLVCNETIVVNCTFEKPQVSIDESRLTDAEQYIVLLLDSSTAAGVTFYNLYWIAANIPKAGLTSGNWNPGTDIIEYIAPNPLMDMQFTVLLFEQTSTDLNASVTQQLLMSTVATHGVTTPGFETGLGQTGLFGNRSGGFLFWQGVASSLAKATALEEDADTALEEDADTALEEDADTALEQDADAGSEDDTGTALDDDTAAGLDNQAALDTDKNAGAGDEKQKDSGNDGGFPWWIFGILGFLMLAMIGGGVLLKPKNKGNDEESPSKQGDAPAAQTAGNQGDEPAAPEEAEAAEEPAEEPAAEEAEEED